MIIFQWGITGISLKKGKLLNAYTHHPMLTFRFLLVTITKVNDEGEALFRSALAGLCQDPDWLIKNAPAIRLEKKRAHHKIAAQERNRIGDNLDYYRAEYALAIKKLRKAEDENCAYKKIITVHTSS